MGSHPPRSGRSLGSDFRSYDVFYFHPRHWINLRT
jgi:hypothetical protein